METLTLIAILLALAATILFLYGAWRIIRETAFLDQLSALLKALGLTRNDLNPIIEASEKAWEHGGVMNPAVIEAGGKTHMFYRAVGDDGVSRIGYASSKDGMRFDERLPYPVFALNNATPLDSKAFAYNSGLIASGGSFAGAEDPRAVVIDDRAYLTFSAFGGWNSLRMAVSSIKLEDLLAKRWKWTPPVYLSPQGQVHKNWVLFPEKVNGKFSILHGFTADRASAQIHTLDTLDTEPTITLESEPGARSIFDDRVWDSQLRGAGPPPIKTKKGWLLLYHANDARESGRYKIGAMLLDLMNPSKVLARAPLPVLAPDAWYENNGKPGIVYACGATAHGDTLRVYYGGADAVVCTATASISKILSKLVPTDAVPVANQRIRAFA